MLAGIRAGHEKFRRSGEQKRQESEMTSSVKNYSISSGFWDGGEICHSIQPWLFAICTLKKMW